VCAKTREGNSIEVCKPLPKRVSRCSAERPLPDLINILARGRTLKQQTEFPVLQLCRCSGDKIEEAMQISFQSIRGCIHLCPEKGKWMLSRPYIRF